MKNKRIYLLIGILTIAIIVMFYFYKVNNTKINVKTYEVSNGSIKKYINLIGEVESNSIERFNFSDGRPRKINVKVGDKVAKGDLIASSSFGNSIFPDILFTGISKSSPINCQYSSAASL